MKDYNNYRQQVPPTNPDDGFLFAPVTPDSPPGEKAQHKTPASPSLKPYKDVK